ncbi:MAG: hypothetical protein ABT02_10600 [Comamonadaceae bacterium SCN 68-20]|nr:Rha family transcriptional regulator [Comamonadaceae bacterium]ODU59335.1 MAG: hypothetical protein ABT02_10600 [Comamonadaceae bacterium SCN 68-20]OJX25034.1 MAG: hypothetical protein BGO75_08775 [Burkholderiales bacterium 68-20]UJB64872.1 Rha family transcriptional regulator [Acidovorax sp. YS12]
MALSLPRASAPIVAAVDGTPTTLSTDVARHFGKPHRDVLRAIETLVEQLPEEALRNFAQGYYTLPETGAQQHKLYRLTRDGFTLLGMGFILPAKKR